MGFSLSIERLRHWSLIGGLSILDQAIYSGANFTTTILLGRWQTPQEYGAFSVAFATFLFLTGIYNALILEPVSVLGPSRFASDKRAYFAAQLPLHFAITFPLSILLGLVGLFLRNALVKQAFLWTAVALPFMLLPWLLRRMYYSNHQPFGALMTSIAYAIALLLGLVIVRHFDIGGFTWVFVNMGIAGLVGGSALLWKFLENKRNFSALSLSDIFHAHWQLGKWIVFAAIFMLAAEQAPIFFVATLNNLENAGGFRAIQNFILPIIQVEAAFSLVGLPVLARSYATKDGSSFRRTRNLLLLGMTSSASLYWICMLVVGDYAVQLAYVGQYKNFADLIPLYAVVPVIVGPYTVFFMSIRAMQRQQIYLINGVTAFLVGIPASYLFTEFFGIRGSIFALIFTYVILLIINIYVYRLWVKPAL